jgi:hypothetical protein
VTEVVPVRWADDNRPRRVRFAHGVEELREDALPLIIRQLADRLVQRFEVKAIRVAAMVLRNLLPHADEARQMCEPSAKPTVNPAGRKTTKVKSALRPRCARRRNRLFLWVGFMRDYAEGDVA